MHTKGLQLHRHNVSKILSTTDYYLSFSMFCYKGMNYYFPCSLMKNGRKNPLGLVCGQYCLVSNREGLGTSL